jgi:hypothetical protein
MCGLFIYLLKTCSEFITQHYRLIYKHDLIFIF